MSFPELVTRINKDIHDHGFAYVIDDWYRKIRPAITGSDFGLDRINKLLNLARTFDDTGNRNALDFIDSVENSSTTDPNESGRVRIMTIHKSKGLGFDIVLTPGPSIWRGYTSSGQLRTQHESTTRNPTQG